MSDPISFSAASAVLPGRDLPGAILTNERLAALMEDATGIYSEHGLSITASDASFPEKRIGILARRVLCSSLSVRDLAVAAGSKALAAAAVAPEQVRVVIVATVTAERVVPVLATTVHSELGLPPSSPAFDLALGCSGFLSALDTAMRYLQGAEEGAAALVIGADAMTRVLDASDRTTCPIFGDGAGAVVLQRTAGVGIEPVETLTLGAFGDRIQIRAEPPVQGEPMLRFVAQGDRVDLGVDASSRARVVMEGRQVFRDILRVAPEWIAAYLDRRGLAVDDVDGFLFHQANLRMIEGMAEARSLRIPSDRILHNIAEVGNTTNASIPILLAESLDAGRIAPGDRVALIGFGTGYSLGITLLQL